MSKFSGRQHKGAMRDYRETKRIEADERDLVSAHRPAGRRARDGELDPTLYRIDSDLDVSRITAVSR